MHTVACVKNTEKEIILYMKMAVIVREKVFQFFTTSLIIKISVNGALCSNMFTKANMNDNKVCSAKQGIVQVQQ